MDFTWEDGGGLLIITDNEGGGCHPAGLYEKALIAEIERLRNEVNKDVMALQRFAHKTGALAGDNVFDHMDKMANELIAIRARNEAMEAALTKAKDHFVHIEEYWNGSRTDGAMFDALEEIEANATKAAAEIDAALSPEKQP